MRYLYDVYLAGPFFNDQQKANMAEGRALLERLGLRVCDPQELSPVIVDLPPEARKQKLFEKIFQNNIQGMIDSEYMIACIDDRDIGTAFEIGYFYQMSGRSHIYTFSASGHGTNVMLSQSAAGHVKSVLEIENVVRAMKREIALAERAVSDE